MGDRELLEWAAKAAGIEYCTKPNVPQYPDMLTLETSARFWNPLTDDGDALRLAAGLGMRLDLSGDVAEASAQGSGGSEPYYDRSPDKADAIRRAIVRAAAEIGKAMS